MEEYISLNAPFFQYLFLAQPIPHKLFVQTEVFGFGMTVASICMVPLDNLQFVLKSVWRSNELITYIQRSKGISRMSMDALMSNVLGVLRRARLYIAGYAKQSFYRSTISAF